MSDMRSAIVPKSDQWNYDDFLSGPLTFTIRGVTVKSGQEQPVEMALEGTDKFYRPCKSMSRVIVTAWGPDSSKYVGRSLTLYGDPKVKWGGLEVGGIRISHMSDIDSAITMALTVTRANKKPFTVRPLVASKESRKPEGDLPDSRPRAEATGGAVTPGPYITPDQIAAIEARCTEHGISIADVKEAASVTELAAITAKRYRAVMAWLDSEIDAKQAT